MAGTRTSHRCDVCRKRKKKCGGERPSCLACIKAGWDCPGYQRQWKFIDETKQLARHYRRNKFVIDVAEVDFSVPPVPDSCAPESFASPQPIEVHQRMNHGEHSPYQNGASVMYPHGIPLSPSLGTDSSGSILAYILTNESSNALFSLQELGQFFPLIPARLGHNEALDTAIACLCNIYTDFLATGTTTSDRTFKAYVKSITALRTYIGDSKHRCTSETICASVILQLCELMTSQDNGRWNSLLRGSAFLIENLDPDRFASGFERELLESQRAMFIAQAMYEGRDCFLAQPRWRKMLEVPFHSAGHPSQSMVLRRRLCDNLVDLPGIARKTAELIQNGGPETGKSSPGCQARLAGIQLNRVLEVKQRLESWYKSAVRHESDGGQAMQRSFPSDVETQPGCLETSTGQIPWSGLLSCVVDCVTNSFLVQLDNMLLCMDYLARSHPSDAAIKFSFCVESYTERQFRAQKAFEMVRSTSPVAAKPLDFGLRQIRSHEEVFTFLAVQRLRDIHREQNPTECGTL